MEPRIGNRFRVGRKLGSGSFGEIFLGSCAIMLKDLVLVPKSPSLPASDEFFPHSLPVGLVLSDECAGTNVQTNEEVAIKLVSSSVFPRFCDLG